ncbi:hypothetical protein KM043_004156 [Ampulex compressa]|nr:hypothetical protein KM043_004156 [Ampulex compressa]
MRYKHIAAVGASLITAVSVLSGLMYYFNQDNCPVGTFVCLNSTVCMPQRSWCNQIMECPYGDDESNENCFDAHGTWEWFKKERNWGLSDDLYCDPSEAPVGCSYNECRATCVEYHEIPQNLSSNVIAIFLTDNFLTRVPTGALAIYPEIRLLYFDNNHIVELEKNAFLNQTELFWLVLTNNKIGEIQPGHLAGLVKLETLRANKNRILAADLSDLEDSFSVYLIDLSRNLLTTDNLKLPRLPALREILLDENRFEWISEELFAGCPALESVSMEGNSISTIDGNAFNNLVHLVELNLAYNEIINIPPYLFHPLKNLTKLLIGYNPINDLPMSLLDPLRNLRSLGVEDINMDNLQKDAFGVFSSLDFVYFKKFHYCTTYAPKVQKCRPASDGVSSLSHLLSKPLLRAAVWGISCVTCMGNALVLWGRFTARDENRVLSIVIRNLAVSDMLMGIYLFIIGVQDVRFRDNYNQMANTWMSSWSCTLLGILAMTSSEVSVLILSFMSVERFMLIAAPLKGHRAMTPQTASSSMIVIWVIGIILALVPAIHWRSSTRFYGVNGMCFPLHIDDPYLIGWEYSAFIVLGLNLLGLMTIGYVYAGMFASIWKTQHATPLSVGDSEFAVRFFLIVLTDAACWMPIIALKILAMMKYPVPADLHAWVVVFILPVNSAVNPLLYTFTTPKFRERLSDGWFGKIRNYITRKQSAQDSQMSTTLSNKNIMLSLSAEKKYSADSRIPPILGYGKEKVASNTHDHIL